MTDERQIKEMVKAACRNLHNGECANCCWKVTCGVEDYCRNLVSRGYGKVDEYKAENANLTVENEVLTRDKANLERTLEEGGEELQATKASLERMTDNYKAILKQCAHLRLALSTAKAEAVKEFAEWVKDHITDVPFCNQKAYNIFCDMVNEKLKEYEK